MSMSFYVAPEQLMKDRADFARKGIARGRSVVVMQYRDGIVFVADNPSRTLHKIGEIYDRIGFAAVGRYNEFENLRVAGVRYADLRGYAYDRRDVSARGLANAYAQQLGAAFSSGAEKPFEVELVVAEVGQTSSQDQLFRIGFDGSISDEPGLAVVGGASDDLKKAVAKHFDPQAELGAALSAAAQCLSDQSQLEVAVLDRSVDQTRKYRVVDRDKLGELLGER